MVTTQISRLATPNNCINRVNRSLFFRFSICAMVTLDWSSRYFSFKFLTKAVYAKNRLVYAKNISEIAENKNVGVISVSSFIFRFFRLLEPRLFHFLFPHLHILLFLYLKVLCLNVLCLIVLVLNVSQRGK